MFKDKPIINYNFCLYIHPVCVIKLSLFVMSRKNHRCLRWEHNETDASSLCKMAKLLAVSPLPFEHQHVTV